MDINTYNIEAYKYIRQEIDNRVQTHYRLIMWKLGIGISILAFLLEKNILSFSPFFLTSIFLMLMDIVIIENLGHIRSSGQYIKQNIENYTGKNNIIRWESDFALLDNNWSCFTKEGYIIGIWIIAPFLIIIGIIEKNIFFSSVNLFMFLIACFFAIFSYIAISSEISSSRLCRINNVKSPLDKKESSK